MYTSRYFLPTLKETPAHAETISHRLMLRAGFIRQLSTGIYHWLPLGLRVLRHIERIVKEEMNRAGAHELLLPAVHPAEIWQETGRWDSFGAELLKMTDRKQGDYCLAPTHEEAITSVMRNDLHSYKQLPMTFYQVQTKFRDETRPRAGVMRGREFLMKDAYSFDIDPAGMAQSYQVMYDTYVRIFDRLGVKYRAVLADTGSMGGSDSHEFQAITESGEDKIAYSDQSQYAANIELASSLAPQGQRPSATAKMEKVDTPGQTTIEAISKFLHIDAKQTVKTLIVEGSKEPLIALILRGDHSLNEIKAEKLPQVASPLRHADAEKIKASLGCTIGSLGPVNCHIPIIVDRDAAHLADFVCGANEEGKHFINVNWQRDVDEPTIADIREVQAGDPSPDGKGQLQFTRGIEIGHIFQLGSGYSNSMNAKVLNQQGKAVPMYMGCYGIGVSRLVAAILEQSHDESGMIWPDSIAPFQIALIPLQYHKSSRVKEACDTLYQALNKSGFSVLCDDRNERAGVLFADMDLIGIPHRIVISERGLDNNTFEYKARVVNDKQDIAIPDMVSFIKKNIKIS